MSRNCLYCAPDEVAIAWLTHLQHCLLLYGHIESSDVLRHTVQFNVLYVTDVWSTMDRKFVLFVNMQFSLHRISNVLTCVKEEI